MIFGSVRHQAVGNLAAMNDSTPAAPDAPVPAPVPETPPANSPPAAATVINGQVTEETLRLREQLSARETEIEELRRQVKDREVTVCEYQDKLRTLADPQKVTVRKRAQEAKPFRLGRFSFKRTL